MTAPSPAVPTVLERLRNAGLRPTTARVSIVQAVEACAAPMTAEDVFRALMRRGISMGFGTAYRALSELAAAGLVARAWVQGRAGAKAMYSPGHAVPATPAGGGGPTGPPLPQP